MLCCGLYDRAVRLPGCLPVAHVDDALLRGGDAGLLDLLGVVLERAPLGVLLQLVGRSARGDQRAAHDVGGRDARRDELERGARGRSAERLRLDSLRLVTTHQITGVNFSLLLIAAPTPFSCFLCFRFLPSLLAIFRVSCVFFETVKTVFSHALETLIFCMLGNFDFSF